MGTMYRKLFPLRLFRRFFFLKSNTLNIHAYVNILVQNLGTDAGALKKFP